MTCLKPFAMEIKMLVKVGSDRAVNLNYVSDFIVGYEGTRPAIEYRICRPNDFYRITEYFDTEELRDMKFSLLIELTSK